MFLSAFVKLMSSDNDWASTDRIFSSAVDAHLSGSHAEALILYDKYLSLCPKVSLVLANKAALLIGRLEYDQAYDLLLCSLAIDSSNCTALANLGYLSMLKGDTLSAKKHFESTLSLNPVHPQALNHLCALCLEQNDVRTPHHYLESALQFDPSNTAALESKANLLLRTESLQSTVNFLTSVLESNQGSHSYVHKLLGNLYLQDENNLDKALHHYQLAINTSLSPSIDLLTNKGECLRKLKKYDAAIEWVNSCLDQHRNELRLVNLKGVIFQSIRRLKEASELYSIAYRLSPFDEQVVSNYAFALLELGHVTTARSVLLPFILKGTKNSSLNHAFAQSAFYCGNTNKAYRYYIKALSAPSPTRNLWDNFLYFVSFSNHVSPRRLQQHFSDYQSYLESSLSSTSLPPFVHDPTPLTSRPLRIGILSGEIGSHCVSQFLYSVISSSSKTQAEFFIFATIDRSTEEKWEQFKSSAHFFACIQDLPDSEAASLIRSCNLDVLLETTQHMSNNRLPLMQLRCAPIQAHYIGMHGSTAVKNIDYFIGDAFVTAPQYSSQFTERLLQLSRTWVSYTTPSQLPKIDHDLNLSKLRFGSFNNVSKVTTSTCELWAHVLRAYPSSILVLKDSLRAENHELKDRFVRKMSRFGVSPSRVTFLDRTESWIDHMHLYNQIDIALDTTPLNSGTTAFDALLMGVPLAGYRTSWMGGSMTASILSGIDRSDWVATDHAGFLSVITAIVSEYETSSFNRFALREQFLSSTLCNSASMSTALVDSLRLVYEQQFFGKSYV